MHGFLRKPFRNHGDPIIHSIIYNENMSENLKFPPDFWFGAATSSHQIEGNTVNQWSEWETANAERLAAEAATKTWSPEILARTPSPLQKENYISGTACDHYNRFEEDFDIAEQLGHTMHRFSIEWSRIEPQKGVFSERETGHYRKVLRALRKRNIEPFVTLWHWTNPVWLEAEGGVLAKKFPFYFARYARYIAEQLGADARYWMTLNEPTSVIGHSYMRTDWPPQHGSIVSAWRAAKNLARAHRAGYAAIHEVLKSAEVGWAHAMHYIEPASRSLLDRLAAAVREYFSNTYFMRLAGSCQDYMAVQYYFHDRVVFPGKTKNENGIVSDMGWEIYPEGIYHVLMRLKKYGKPIYVTENGLADADDSRRAQFIENHLAMVSRAIAEGADVRGYLYWSLLDNFEWAHGFWPRFGLVAIDYQTLARTIRPSALRYAEIIRSQKTA